MVDKAEHTASVKVETGSSDRAARDSSGRYTTRTRSSLIDEIIDLNVSATRFNQQVLSTVFGVLSDVLDASNEHPRPGSRRIRRFEADLDDMDDEMEGAETRTRNAVQSGLSELTDKFDRAASSMRRKSGP